MTRKERVAAVHEIAVEVGGEVYDGYSGRGMFGKPCLGISCNDANECLEVAGSHGLKGGQTDQLGRGYIVYWPSIRAEEEVS